MNREELQRSLDEALRKAPYCQDCGAQMVKIRESVTYNTFTGAKQVRSIHRCPNRPRWWQFFRIGCRGY